MMNENLDRKVQVAKADVELSRGHLDRLDEIDNAVYQMCQVLTEDEDLPWGVWNTLEKSQISLLGFWLSVDTKYGFRVLSKKIAKNILRSMSSWTKNLLSSSKYILLVNLFTLCYL